jgi:hypothetical protein
MEREKLKQHLLAEGTRLFCILDGASVPELPMQLYKMQAANECLFKGDLEPDMLYVAPFVVHLPADGKITDWVFGEGFGKHWGIFVQSRRSMNEMRRHFRSLVSVYDEDARSLIFRYYDPRVLHKFLPTCDGDQLIKFFGDVDAFFAEDGANLVRYRLDKGKLTKKDLN